MPEKPLNQLDPGLQRQVEHARNALERGNPDYAIGLLGDVLRREPGCLAVRRALRTAQVRRSGAGSALTRFVRSGLLFPGLVLAGLFRRGEPSRVLELAERVLDWDPHHPGALRRLAAAALAMELRETAVFALESALESRPDDHRSAVALARVLLELGRPGEALAVAERWSRRLPRDDVFRDLLKEALVAQSLHRGRWDSDSGTYRDKLRDEEQAVDLEKRSRSATPAETLLKIIRESREAIAKEPESLNHHVALVRAYQDSGDYENALEWLERARRLRSGASDPSLARRAVELRVARLKARKATGKEIAEEWVCGCRQLVEDFPRESPFRFELAGHLRSAGWLDEAIRHYQEVQQVGVFRVRATAGLAECFQLKGLPDLAFEQYRAAADALPVMDDLKKHVVYQLALCHEAAGRPDQALAAFKQIYSADIGYRDVATRIEAASGDSRTA